MSMLLSSCTKTQLEGISLWRGPKQEPLEEDAQKLLALLLPHLQTALRLRQEVARRDTTKAFADTVLDRMGTAALLATGDGRVLHRNKYAVTLLAKNDGLRLHNERLVTASLVETSQLEQLLKAAALHSPNIPPGGAMRIRRASAAGPLHATVVPVPRESQVENGRSCAVLFLNDPAEKPAGRATLLRQLYGLTAAESRLADYLLQGCETREIADKMHTTLATARFHLKRVLAKTGTRRQSQLMRLMLMLPGDKA